MCIAMLFVCVVEVWTVIQVTKYKAYSNLRVQNSNKLSGKFSMNYQFFVAIPSRIQRVEVWLLSQHSDGDFVMEGFCSGEN